MCERKQIETNTRNMRLGELELVANKKKKRGVNKKYWAVHCRRGEASVTLLMTKDQMLDLEKKAKANPEDIPTLKKPGYLAKLFGG